jgi:hypothetical protein
MGFEMAIPVLLYQLGRVVGELDDLEDLPAFATNTSILPKSCAAFAIVSWTCCESVTLTAE